MPAFAVPVIGCPPAGRDATENRSFYPNRIAGHARGIAKVYKINLPPAPGVGRCRLAPADRASTTSRHRPMFGFLTSGKDLADPLASAKTVSLWLRQLPALDVIGRQQHVMRAFDALRLGRKEIDPARVGAIQFLDAALGTDRRQLIRQYVENAESSPKLAERLWQAIYELTQVS